jgi:hypothetical protein
MIWSEDDVQDERVSNSQEFVLFLFIGWKLSTCSWGVSHVACGMMWRTKFHPLSAGGRGLKFLQ